MDPLSISAGVVGFLGFAIQTAMLAAKVKKAMDDFRAASKEVQCLAHQLEIIEMVCGMMETHLSKSKALLDPASSVTLGPISEALGQCNTKVTRLDRALSRLIPDYSERQPPTRTRHIVARICFALGQDEIKSIMTEVGQAVSTLQLVMTANIW